MRFKWNQILPLLLVLTFGIYVNTANAFLFEFIFGKATNTKNNESKVSENITVQNMTLLGEGNLNGKKDTIGIFKKLVNNSSSAFTIEQGALHSNVDVAVEEENSHSMDEMAVYTVQPDDTLASIASYFEVTPDTIATFNKLNNAKVSSGDVLEIPQISGILYTIKKGDSLEKIAKDFKVESEDISLYNAIIPNIALNAGEDIFLPGAKLAKVEIKKDTAAEKAKKDKEAKTKSEALAKSKNKKDSKEFKNDKTAISKIKRFVGKFGDLPQIVGYYTNPAPGSVRTQKMHGANGVDLAAPIGTTIIAAAEGTVSVAKSTGWNYGYGQYIVISHPNGTQTVYAHLSNVSVAVGQSVEKGEKIGNMGSTGNSTGPHVHFEVRGAYNPFAW